MSSMYEPDGWTAVFPTDVTVEKRWFDHSDYAQIWKLSNGRYAVKKIPTGVYWFCSTYNEALGIRRLIVERISQINRELKG